MHYSLRPGGRAKGIARVARAAVEGRASEEVHQALLALALALAAADDDLAARHIETAEEAVLEAWEAQLS